MMTRMVMVIVVMGNFHDYGYLLKFLISNLSKEFHHGNEDSDDDT